MKTRYRIIAMLMLVASFAVSTGCNTTEGVGKDVEKAGEKLQDAADRNK